MTSGQYWRRNGTLWGVLWNGCIDRAYLDFCASRITDFACVFWTDARALETVSKDGDSKAFDDAFQSWFVGKKNITAEYSGLSEFGDMGIDINKIMGDLKPVKEDTSTAGICTAIRGKPGLIDARFQLAQAIFLPWLLLLAVIGNIIITRILYRLGRQQLPVCLYAAIISGLDLLVLLIRAGDLWVQAVTEKSPTILFLLIHQSLCQVATFAFSCLTHFHAFVYIALAVDNWRLVRNPKAFFPVYTRAWVRHACLLMLALVLTLNAQFLWTFAVVRQNATSKKARGFICLFADKFSEERFRDYVWPVIDFVVADYLPGGVVATLTIWSACILLRTDRQAGDQAEENPRVQYRQPSSSQIESVTQDNSSQQSQPCLLQEIPQQSSQRQARPSSSNSRSALRSYVVDVPLFFAVRRAVVTVCAVFLLLHAPQNCYYAFKYHQYRTEAERERMSDPSRMFTSEAHRQQRRMERLAMRTNWRPFYEKFEFVAQLCAFLDYSLKFLIYVVLVPPIRKRFIKALFAPFLLCRYGRDAKKRRRKTVIAQKPVFNSVNHSNINPQPKPKFIS